MAFLRDVQALGIGARRRKACRMRLKKNGRWLMADPAGTVHLRDRLLSGLGQEHRLRLRVFFVRQGTLVLQLFKLRQCPNQVGLWRSRPT